MRLSVPILLNCILVLAVYLADKMISFGQYADYPDYKVYDSVNISKYLQEDNQVSLLVWYYGIDTQTYIKDNAGVIFEVKSDGDILVQSDENIDCRICNLYENARKKKNRLTGDVRRFSFVRGVF